MSLLPALAPSLTQAASKPGKHVACPVHGGKDGFRFFKNVAETGGGVCNTCGPFPDGFAVLQWVNGWTFPETLTQVAQWLEAPSNPPVASTVAVPPEDSQDDSQDDAQDEAQRRHRIDSVWQETRPDTGRIAAYLRSRGLSGTVPRSLRLHPRLGYYEGGYREGFYPAMLAQVRHTGSVVTVHCTYLGPDGDGKADVAVPKKCLPPITPGGLRGGAIHLTEPGRTLAITEGIETGLAVWEATSTPVWAAGSAHALETITIPASVVHVQLWADNDRSWAGQQAAFKAAQRLSSQGKDVTVLVPREDGFDWLDMLVTEGPDSLQHALSEAPPSSPPVRQKGGFFYGR